MSGLQWIRRRRRTLARAVLPLVALAWLQVAAVPCVAAHQSAGVVAAVAQESVGPHADHEPCIYCPPHHAGHGAAGEADGRCAFPHDPQVDARVAALAIAPPVALTSFALPPEPAQATRRLTVDLPDPVPRCPLTVSYCRFIE
jgi:hypothetical protein